MITGALMLLAAAGFFGVGVYTIRAGRLPGPSWFRNRRSVPAWATGLSLLMFGASSTLWAISEFSDNLMLRLPAWCIYGATVFFRLGVNLRHPDQQEVSNTTRSEGQPPTTTSTAIAGHATVTEAATLGDIGNQT
ncbi:hypothetical protein [Rugosimonospora africana]|uniref:hypothetical protein n=1 Tax=Rugosimonospora africana TaxID=556532 RepID=UPI0019419348|nr:hypothetical protein [Rugosimonospora africana]